VPNFPEDPNERIQVFFDLSWTEFVQLATAIDVGSDIAFGDEGLKAWWTWVRSVNDMQICEAIIDCLTNDEDTRNAFSEYVSNEIRNNTWLTKILNELADNRKGITASNCNDGLFATIKQTIQYVDTHTIDWLQKVEDSGLLNAEELFAAFAASLGGSAGAWGVVVNFTQAIFDNLIDAYRSVSTSELIDEVACDIFCGVKDSCDVSIDDIALYFENRVTALYPYDVQSMFAYLFKMTQIVAGAGGREVFDIMMNNFFKAVKLSNFIIDGTIGGMYRFKDKFDSFTNDSDADWAFLCECGTTEKTMRAYGRGYSINGGELVVVNPTTDAHYTYTCNIDDEVTLVCNGTAVASGDWEGNALQTITITYLSLAGGQVTGTYENVTGTSLGAWDVGSTIVNAQANAFGLSAMSFTVDA